MSLVPERQEPREVPETWDAKGERLADEGSTAWLSEDGGRQQTLDAAKTELEGQNVMTAETQKKPVDLFFQYLLEADGRCEKVVRGNHALNNYSKQLAIADWLQREIQKLAGEGSVRRDIGFTAHDLLRNLDAYRPWQGSERMSDSEEDHLSLFLKGLSGADSTGEGLTIASTGEQSTDLGSSKSSITSQGSLKTGVTRSVRQSAPRNARSESYMTRSRSAASRPGEDRSVGKSD